MAAEELKNAKVIFVMGGPGSGKATQCSRLVANYGLTHLSSGDLLRAEVALGTEGGRRLRRIMRTGDLVPLVDILRLLRDAMIARSVDSPGFLLDGYPRDTEQAIRFESTLAPCRAVIFLDVPEEVMRKRLQLRGRETDSEEFINKKMKVFRESTIKVVEHYARHGKLIRVDGDGTIEEVYSRVRAGLMSYRTGGTKPATVTSPATGAAGAAGKSKRHQQTDSSARARRPSKWQEVKDKASDSRAGKHHASSGGRRVEKSNGGGRGEQRLQQDKHDRTKNKLEAGSAGSKQASSRRSPKEAAASSDGRKPKPQQEPQKPASGSRGGQQHHQPHHQPHHQKPASPSDSRGTPKNHQTTSSSDNRRGTPKQHKAPASPTDSRGGQQHHQKPASPGDSRGGQQHHQKPASPGDSRGGQQHHQKPASPADSRGGQQHHQKPASPGDSRGGQQHHQKPASPADSRGAPKNHQTASRSDDKRRGNPQQQQPHGSGGGSHGAAQKRQPDTAGTTSRSGSRDKKRK